MKEGKDISNNKIKEVIQNEFPFIQANILYRSLRTTCQIIVPNGVGSGFFLKLENKPLYCLLTNEHVITKELINSKVKIIILYDNKKKSIILKLNEERFIKEYSHIGMDLTIVEILVSDNIDSYYFIPYNYEINNFDK